MIAAICMLLAADPALEPPLGPAGGATLVQSSDDAVEKARESLSKRRYPWYDSNADDYRALPPPREYDWDWLPDWLTDWSVGESLGGALRTFATAAMWTLFGLLAVAVAAVLVYHLRHRIPDASDEREERAAEVEVDALESLPAPVRHYDDFLAEAERRVAAGDLQSAVVFLHSYFLLALDRAGCIVLAKGKTNRRYLRELKDSQPRYAPLLDASIVQFERAFFGKLEVGREAFEALWANRGLFRGMMEGRGE